MQALRSFGRKIRRFIKSLTFANIKQGLYCIYHYGPKATIARYRRKEENYSLYKEWQDDNYPTEAEIKAQRAVKFEQNPLISIIIPAYNTPIKFLKDLLDSLRAQTYQNYEVCIADGNSQNADKIKKALESHKISKKIKYVKLDENLNIVGNSNAALKLATGDFVALLDHDDALPAWSLFEVVKVINENPDADFIYSDEDKFDEADKPRVNPHFKPDFSPDYLRTCNYICHFSVFKKSLMDELGGFREGFDGSQDHDLVLRASEKAQKIIHIPKVLYHWRAHRGSVAGGGIGAKPYAIEAGIKAVQSHIDRIGLKGKVTSFGGVTAYKVVYEVDRNALISIIIPNKDHVEDLDKCVNSILEKSTYENYEIIVVENNSEEPATFEYYKELEKNEKIKVITYKEKGFNFSKINNFGVKQSSGEYLLFLNNDTEVIAPNFLEEMLAFAQREDIGAVGAQLIYPDDTIQHAGVVIGIGGIAGHVHVNLHKDSEGILGRALYPSNFSAVTGACMMVKRKDFDDVNGFTEELAVAFNDIDFCVKILQLGKYNVYAPAARLYHYESKSRGLDTEGEKHERFKREGAFFEQKWLDFLQKGDPFYNPNLSLVSSGFEIKAGPYKHNPARFCAEQGQSDEN